ncbi:hypothetical protein J8M20_06595 [Pseudoalteromonas luteoviolacea]|uniref:hypothetical protein n=1 Tax=Pseudoalteromonas luteoviolacea TaxID=43657 RepID=UPI001B358A46|nr:hypothetical protein [Pseudoalteromonas luteoviolacea]MBQ4810996.1 hypothetical protein [Pseudoalteromonas luteoviolacea]
MKIKLNKKKLISLSDDASVLPQQLTPQIVGGYLSVQICGPTISCGRCYANTDKAPEGQP